jgi:hypothetical protein
MDTITLLTIAGFIVAFWLGKHYAQIKFLHKISEDPDKMIELLQQIKKINTEDAGSAVPGIIEVETVNQGTTVYAYNKLNGEFLAQSTDLHQVMTEAAKRFPGKKFWHPELNKDTQST